MPRSCSERLHTSGRQPGLRRTDASAGLKVVVVAQIGCDAVPQDRLFVRKREIHQLTRDERTMRPDFGLGFGRSICLPPPNGVPSC